MPDLFPIFRWLLFVFVTIYFCITTIQTIVTWYGILSGRDRYTGLIRRYLLVQTLRVRMARFRNDGVICILLCIAFILLWRAHFVVDQTYQTYEMIEAAHVE